MKPFVSRAIQRSEAKRIEQITHILRFVEHEYLGATAEEISAHFKVSPRTAQTWIFRLKREWLLDAPSSKRLYYLTVKEKQ